MSNIEIYKAKDGQTQIEVQFDEDTVWLTQKQMAQLFQTTPQNITIHLKNVYKSAELQELATCKEYLQVQKEGKKQVQRKQQVYNLDVILSVGYRINSKRGTQFRQWATQRLKDYLVQGYAINEKRLEQLQRVINIVQQSGDTKELSARETKGLLDIITNYTRSFILLNRFDSNKLTEEQLNENISYEIEHRDAVKAIEELKKQLIKQKEASPLFGNQKDQSFAGILNSIIQQFDGKYLYPSIEEQAATCCISLSRTTRLPMVINVSALFCLYGSWKKTGTGLKTQAN